VDEIRQNSFEQAESHSKVCRGVAGAEVEKEYAEEAVR
jgi:hypothetical protein